MQNSNKIIINTLAQYARTIINIVLTLYSSRLVLEILGIEDYGIYTLVGGVVSLLSFFTNSLVGSTQRFLSVSQGKGNINELKKVFSNCLILHIVIGFLVTLLLESMTPFIFDGFLNIPQDRILIAQMLFQLVIWMVYLTFIASPFRALLISRENIVYISLIDVIDGILKVVLVIMLPFITMDKLLGYGWIMFSIQLFNLLAFLLYCYIKYEECVIPRVKSLNFTYVKEMSAFTGWVIFSAGVIAIRTQGFAIVLNKLMGTTVNAAYGIGSQIAGMIAFVSTSFNNAISPQLMAAEGGGDRNKMWRLAEIESKFSFLLLAMLGIPSMFEMNTLLRLWLGKVPEYTIIFGCMFIAMQIVDMLSMGLVMANRAIGKIKKYTLITVTPKLFVLPIAWFLLKNNFSLTVIVILFITIEALCMYLRIHLFKNEKGFSIYSFCKNVIQSSMIPAIVSICICSIVR